MTVCLAGELEAAGLGSDTGEDGVGGWSMGQGYKGETKGGASGSGDDTTGAVGEVAGIGDGSAAGLGCTWSCGTPPLSEVGCSLSGSVGTGLG